MKTAGVQAKARAKLLKALLWVAALGPTAFIVADRVAHMFGLCLGM